MRGMNVKIFEHLVT